MNKAWTDYRRLKEQGGKFEVLDHSVLEFRGEDWRTWLQGQVTQDLRLLTESNPVSFCLCKPTGQLLSFGRLYLKSNGEARIVVPTASVPAILSRVDQMVILEDCEVEVLHLKVFHSVPALGGTHAVNRIGSEGEDLFEPQDDLLDPEAVNIARLEAGIPDWTLDTGEKTLPPELGPWFDSEFVHYVKGCYTGQEVLQRIHSQGHTNKVWAVYLASEKVNRGEKVFANGRDVGVVSSVVEHPDHGWMVGATVRHDAEGTLNVDSVILTPFAP